MPRSFFRYLVIVLSIIIISFGYGYFRTLLSFKDPNKNVNIEYLEQDAVQTPEIKLNAKAKIKYITFYIGCGDEIIEEKNVDEEYVGFTKSDLQQAESGWIIESFTPEQAILIKEINGICSEHYYIGINDGYVALFQGIPGMQSSSLMEQTDILADILREDDRQILEKGLIINDKQEFYKIREGLTN